MKVHIRVSFFYNVVPVAAIEYVDEPVIVNSTQTLFKNETIKMKRKYFIHWNMIQSLKIPPILLLLLEYKSSSQCICECKAYITEEKQLNARDLYSWMKHWRLEIEGEDGFWKGRHQRHYYSYPSGMFIEQMYGFWLQFHWKWSFNNSSIQCWNSPLRYRY